jgi:hypothetical protein
MGAVQSAFVNPSTHAQVIGRLREILRTRSSGRPAEDFVLRGLWSIDYRYRPNEFERDKALSLVLAQTIRQGCCYVNYGTTPEIDDSQLSRDARELRPADTATEIAVLDAAYAALDRSPAESHEFEGVSQEKAVERARIVVDEVARLCGGSVRGVRILQVGVMGNFIHQLVERGASVVASDFDPKLVDRVFNGAHVFSGTETLRLVGESDVVLATGMTLSTCTLGDIMEAVSRRGARLVLFAATGASFAEEYCRSFGVDVTLSELQPQYMFQGKTTIEIYRREGL